MNYMFYDESEVPKPSTSHENYIKVHVYFLTSDVKFSEVSNWDWAYDFGANDIKRKIIYEPYNGRIWYITDIPVDSRWFCLDLFNKLLPYYWCAAGILDKITMSAYDTEESVLEDNEIERQRDRYDAWCEEVEHLDSILNNLQIGIY